jgi:hypothetical protein
MKGFIFKYVGQTESFEDVGLGLGFLFLRDAS